MDTTKNGMTWTTEQLESYRTLNETTDTLEHTNLARAGNSHDGIASRLGCLGTWGFYDSGWMDGVLGGRCLRVWDCGAELLLYITSPFHYPP